MLVGACALLWVIGCAAEIAHDHEEEPDETGAVSYALSSLSCVERAATGYRRGTPFSIRVVTVDGEAVERKTANAYYVMAQTAQRAGVQIRVISGFRTMAEQRWLYGCFTSCSCNNCNLAARPGYSNHQSGHALDLNTRAPDVLRWLNNNAARFGFRRTVASEPWHWEWWGGGPGGGPCAAKARSVDWCKAHWDRAPDAYFPTLANAAEHMPRVPDRWGDATTSHGQCMAKLACRYSEWRAGRDGERVGMYGLPRDDFPYGEATLWKYRNGGSDERGEMHTARYWQSYAAFRHVVDAGYDHPCQAWANERRIGMW